MDHTPRSRCVVRPLVGDGTLTGKKNRDINDIARLEKAIREKYGEEAIANPKSLWDQEKEKKHLKQLKKFYTNNKKEKPIEKKEGFSIKSRDNATRLERTCPVCGTYSFSVKDDVYMNRYECCFKCFIEYVEDREERWKTGWRPNG